MKYFKVHETLINTDYGCTVLDNIRPELNELNPPQVLAERFIRALESINLTQRVLLNDSLKPYVEELKLDVEIERIPETFESLLDRLTPEPIWVLTASKTNRGLLGVLISSEPEFQVTSLDAYSKVIADLTLGVAPMLIYRQLEYFDLTYTHFSLEQQLILALMAIHTLKESAVFQAKDIHLIIKDNLYSVKSLNQNLSFNAKEVPDYSSYYYLSQEQTEMLNWGELLVKSGLREKFDYFYQSDLTEFNKWAQLWLQDQDAALAQLENLPPSPLLFQALALHADPQLFLKHSDKIVAVNFLDVREPMALMFDRTVQTRRGLSLDPSDVFIAYDPVHVKSLCNQLPRDYRQIKMSQEKKAQGLAIEFWRQYENR